MVAFYERFIGDYGPPNSTNGTKYGKMEHIER